MPFTVGAFSQSLDPGGVYTRLAGVTNDQTLKVQGAGNVDIIVPEVYNKIIGAVGLVGTLGGDCRFTSPRLRRYNPFYAVPTIELLVPPSVHPIWTRPDLPVNLDSTEQLNFEENSDPAAAEQHAGIVLLADGPISPITGEFFTVRATITLALTAGSWAFSQLTIIDNLPIGNYAVVGARVVAATGVAFRFVPVVGGNNQRPGGLCCVDTDDIDDWHFRRGFMGEWFTFNTTQLPGVEILGSAAVGGTTYQVYIDLTPK